MPSSAVLVGGRFPDVATSGLVRFAGMNAIIVILVEDWRKRLLSHVRLRPKASYRSYYVMLTREQQTGPKPCCPR